MPEENFDNGLVHNHAWAQEPATLMPAALPPVVSHAASVPTPSTVLHDDWMGQQG